jgi:hypothetical protein
MGELLAVNKTMTVRRVSRRRSAATTIACMHAVSTTRRENWTRPLAK